MQRKLNEEFIKEYSEQFSEKITSGFFEDHDVITGKEILNLTPCKQVNFFILKSLFSKWQEEMKKLESPYFNYKQPEVRRAMVDFMNTLSQHIEIDGDHFIELAEEAVRSTLVLMLTPTEYLQQEFTEKNISEISEKVTKPLLKYIKVYKSEFESVFEEHSEQSTDRVLVAIEEFFEEFDDDEEVIKEELSNLCEILPAGLNEFLLSAEASADQEPWEDTDDMGEDDSEPESAVSASEEERESDQEEDEEIEHSSSEEQPDAASKEEEIEEIKSEQSEKEELPDETKEDAPDESPEESVNEKFAESPGTLNDKFSEGKHTMVDELEQKKVSSIMGAISVNHKYMFTKELFDGDRDAFSLAIEEVEKSDSFDDAVELLVEKHAKEREWDMNSEEVKELLKIVFRKYR